MTGFCPKSYVWIHSLPPPSHCLISLSHSLIQYLPHHRISLSNISFLSVYLSVYQSLSRSVILWLSLSLFMSVSLPLFVSLSLSLSLSLSRCLLSRSRSLSLSPAPALIWVRCFCVNEFGDLKTLSSTPTTRWRGDSERSPRNSFLNQSCVRNYNRVRPCLAVCAGC